ncbi:hypothetical protein ACHAWF_001284, partial [Thalassiosira exigua]
EDEDYVPGADKDDDDASDEGGGVAAAEGDDDDRDRPFLPPSGMRAVDDAFLDLFGHSYDAGPLPRESSQAKSLDKIPAKASQTRKRTRSVLSSIFGPRSSRRLLSRSKFAADGARPKPATGRGMIRLERRVVAEVKRFAGQEIEVKKVVVVPVMAGDEGEDGEDGEGEGKGAAEEGAARSTTKPPPAAVKGVDRLLEEMSRPEKLSTITKTSADWDLFKAKNSASLKEELEDRAEGKEAYLVKKDFLDRVDRRRFELEKAERDRGRAKRGK